jgi:hypothetical protein
MAWVKKDRSRASKLADRRTTLTYYRSKTQPQAASPFQKRPVKKSYRLFWFGLLDIILIILLLAGLIYASIVNPKPNVIVSNTVFHRQSDYQIAADRLFSSLKNRNKLTYDGSSVANKLKQQFPELVSVNSELPLLSQKATLRIAISRPGLLVNNHSRNYVVDTSGTVVAKTQNLPNIKSLPQLIDQSGFNAQLGRPILNAAAVNFVRTLFAECQLAKVPIASLTLPPVAQEIDLRTTDQPYYVKFYFGGDVLQQTGQFLAARKNLSKTNQVPSQYLDVRVSGKIFYK